MAATRAPRRKRRREITADDITDLAIEEYTQEQSTKGSYSSYIGPFVDFAVENGLHFTDVSRSNAAHRSH